MKIFILGAGGQAREMFYLLRDIDAKLDVVFIDDVNTDSKLTLAGRDWPILRDWVAVAAEKARGRTEFTTALGSPAGKRKMVAKALAAGLRPAPTWVHPTAVVQDAQLGLGGMVCPGVVITCNVRIGDHVLINWNAGVGHDVVIGDYSTVGPGAVLAGKVRLGHGVFIGAGAVLREKISVAEDVTVGAQACVVSDLTDTAAIVVGVPAKPL